MTQHQVQLSTALQTEAFGACWGKVRPVQGVVNLSGDLGAGKTTLARGFLRACGYSGVVKSPTFTLVEPYLLASGPVYHFDLYRLNDPLELECIGARELLGSPGICLLEWPSRGAGMLPSPDVIILLQTQNEARLIHYQAGTEVGERWLTLAHPCISAIN
ncbi:MAG: tRNA (adenosine(37)-N6)-threonylcarbamoyltransferase complex ATPase subunit type 1 TsaE [Gammaproteobacteria bacterium]|nr:tRNA (adenosine(37)-N6)-threonylcarbamoyltransferase complex ATPase subunit type 1 TsaE [Gammaproteobacteria bacterium]